MTGSLLCSVSLTTSFSAEFRILQPWLRNLREEESPLMEVAGNVRERRALVLDGNRNGDAWECGEGKRR